MDLKGKAKEAVLRQIIDMAQEAFLKKVKDKKAKAVSIEMTAIKPKKVSDLSSLRKKLMEE